jgi:hypothetical protein
MNDGINQSVQLENIQTMRSGPASPDEIMPNAKKNGLKQISDVIQIDKMQKYIPDIGFDMANMAP